MDLKSKKILITGVCGTVGNALIEKLIELAPVSIIGIDNNESEIFFMSQRYRENTSCRFFCCDITDNQALVAIMQGCDYVFHLAATKHVTSCEDNPSEGVRVNVEGTKSVISAAKTSNVSKVLLTSTDKAVEPVSVMGATKLVAERLFCASGLNFNEVEGPIFTTCRFGNVVGSNGSVVSLFDRLLALHQNLTLTHENMTRFVMTTEQAASLIIKAIDTARGGEIFITKMPAINIRDLAEVMIELQTEVYGYNPHEIDIEVIGIKPGEKLYEQLMTSEENALSIETTDFFIINGLKHRDDYRNDGKTVLLDGSYKVKFRSDEYEMMTKEMIKSFLTENRVLESL